MRCTLAPIMIAVIVLAACGDDDYYQKVPDIGVVDVREEQERERAPSPELIQSLAYPDVAGRIIYEPPPNLARISAADSIVGQEARGSSAGGSPTRRGAAPSRPDR